jgi:hypothetical protein
MRSAAAGDESSGNLQLLNDMNAENEINKIESREKLESVIGAIVSESPPEAAPVLTPADILVRAEEMGEVETIFGGDPDPMKSLVFRLMKLQGRQLSDATGRRFEFGRRDAAAGSGYAIRFL